MTCGKRRDTQRWAGSNLQLQYLQLAGTRGKLHASLRRSCRRRTSAQTFPLRPPTLQMSSSTGIINYFQFASFQQRSVSLYLKFIGMSNLELPTLSPKPSFKN